MQPRIGAVALALALDVAFGEPPPGLHPVVWIGKAIELLGRRRPRDRARQLVQGVVHVALIVGGAALAGSELSREIRSRRPGAGLVAEAWLLKTSLSLRALVEAAHQTQWHLERGDLESARRDLRALVSRPTAALGPSAIASAAVESVAENAADSVVAPLLYYVLGGLPAALAYRAANTLDAMIGYRGDLEYIGKTAARVDDLLNFLPARLTAALIVLAAALTGGDTAGAWSTLCRDRSRTASPNAGWPMSAMAGALGVQLEKPGAYRLGAPLPPPDPTAIDHAVQVLVVATGLAVPVLLGVARWRSRSSS